MTSQSNLYDADRIQKIGSIMPKIVSFAKKGDEIHLGLVGDPEFPYRNSRPTGIIEDMRKEDDTVVVTAKMKNGEIMELPSTTISAHRVWEFSDKTFDEKIQESKNNAQSVTNYRGAPNEDLLKRIEKIEKTLSDNDALQKTFRSTIVGTFNEIAKDVVSLGSTTGLEPRFCGTLVQKTEQMSNKKKNYWDDKLGNIFRNSDDGIEKESDHSDEEESVVRSDSDASDSN